MPEITTTLNRIREHKPCEDGWFKLLKHLGKTKADDEPLPYRVIVDSNGIEDALWCCRAEPQHAKEWRLYAVWCARQVQHLMTDKRSIEALDVAERYANGSATEDELCAACEAACEAARAATCEAPWEAASDAACDSARNAASDAACEAARNAALAAAVASITQRALLYLWARACILNFGSPTPWEAARAAAIEKQKIKFLEVVCQR
jgi:hypothetical protein